MVRSFTTEERKEIREQLIAKGKEFFSVFGLQKTNIEELTNAAGISKGSFYTFFESKEAFYFEIFREEEEQLRNRIIRTLDPEKPLTRDRFCRFLKEAFRMVDNHPIIQRMYLRNEYEQIMRRLPQKYHDQHTEEDINYLRPLIEQWQSQGSMIPEPPEIITSAIRALFTITLHKDELGEEYYAGTVDLLIRSLAAGLLPETETCDD